MIYMALRLGYNLPFLFGIRLYISVYIFGYSSGSCRAVLLFQNFLSEFMFHFYVYTLLLFSAMETRYLANLFLTLCNICAYYL